MRLRLHRLGIALESADAPVRAAWAELFDGWLEESPAEADVCLRLALRPALPAPPPKPPVFDDSHLWPDGVGVLRVYDAPDGVLLHFANAGQVSVPLSAVNARPEPIEGVVVPGVFRYGRFEDVTLTSLAPALRRQGYFLLHAFTAARDGRCVVIVGPTGSGKTTTGLNLILSGWGLLANDAVVLEQRQDVIYALPTPGSIGVRAGTFDLLPALAAQLDVDGQAAVEVPAARLVAGEWALPTPAAALLFPELTDGQESTAEPLPPAVALARALAESADRWDLPMLDAHVSLLGHLCRQARPYALRLGRDMNQLARLIATL